MEEKNELPYYFKIRDDLTNLEKRDETNYLLDFVDYALNKLDQYQEGDIRYDYYLLMKNIIINYSLNIKNYFLRVFVDYEKNTSIEELKKHTEDSFRGELDPTIFSYRSLKTSLERTLIIESWSNFEFAVTTIFEKLFTQSEVEEYTNKHLERFKKILRKRSAEIGEEKINTIAEELNKGLDKHIPTMNKVNKILKKVKCKYPEKESNVNFLQFFGRLRNGIHNNFIYKGPHKPPFEFKGNKYIFENGKSILEVSKSQFDEMEIVGELLRVILKFFECLIQYKKIDNPLPTLEEFAKGSNRRSRRS